MKTILILAGLAAFAAAGPALAAQPKLLGTFTDWDAFTNGSGNAKTCWAITVPKRTKPQEVDHTGVFFMVSHKPGKKISDEVRFGARYTLKSNKDGTAIMGGFKEPLFNSGKDAWAYDAASDKRIVATMKGAALLTVKEMAANGDNTEYDFSLSGFTAAINAAKQACGS
ncbi:hypothetical protein [Emcibacter sp. SYSU 3D8]|uniref:hypothetical protein n=1 Tax=Emcibacter sp. SYSU 3D8 TaxID=3133969 RepID=UPI0031FF17FD